MEESEADAIAQAILRPDPKIREDIRRKKAHREWWVGEKRKIIGLMAIGFALGAVVAFYSGHRFTAGGAWGAISGGIAGWLWVGGRWLRRRLARVVPEGGIHGS